MLLLQTVIPLALCSVQFSVLVPTLCTHPTCSHACTTGIMALTRWPKLALPHASTSLLCSEAMPPPQVMLPIQKQSWHNPLQGYGAQQPGYPPQRPAPPQIPQHQVPYASQPMYPQQAPAYPTYPPAAAAAPYYAAPAYQPQMHVNPMPPVQQPNQSAAQAAMMASIKVRSSHCEPSQYTSAA